MLIKQLQQAEKLVSLNKDLRWAGWNIISRTITSNGYTSRHGSFIDGKWGIDKIYPITENGWYLPNKYRINND